MSGSYHSSVVGSTVWNLSADRVGSRRPQLPHLAASPGCSEEGVLASPHTRVQVDEEEVLASPHTRAGG